MSIEMCVVFPSFLCYTIGDYHRRGGIFVSFTFEMLEDKVEFFEAVNLVSLEKKINEQIDNNKALMLEVHHISHQMIMDPESKRPYYSAVVHFKLKKLR
jgi:hypothetical protein